MLVMYVIYSSPEDFPGKFVARRWEIDGGGTYPREAVAVVDSLEEARLAIPRGLVKLDRHPSDATSVVETWL